MEQLKSPLRKFLENESLGEDDSLVIHNFFVTQMKRHLPEKLTFEHDADDLLIFCNSYKPILPIFKEFVVKLFIDLFFVGSDSASFDWDHHEQRFTHLVTIWSQETDISELGIFEWEAPDLDRLWRRLVDHPKYGNEKTKDEFLDSMFPIVSEKLREMHSFDFDVVYENFIKVISEDGEVVYALEPPFQVPRGVTIARPRRFQNLSHGHTCTTLLPRDVPKFSV